MGNASVANLPSGVVRIRLKKQSFGHWLQSKRKDLCLSQDEVAQRVEVKKAYISKLENRPEPPPIETLDKIAVALGTTIEEPLVFLGYIKPKQNEDVNTVRLAIKLRKLSPVGSEIISDVIDVLAKRLPNSASDTGEGHGRRGRG